MPAAGVLTTVFKMQPLDDGGEQLAILNGIMMPVRDRTELGD